MANGNYFEPVDVKVSFPDLEKKILEEWDKKGLVQKYLHKNDSSDKYFSFLDGPITANNPMGVHHAWGRSYKDLWQRFKTMQGYKQRYQNGFDCQGLWVEVEVEKELGLKTKKDIENIVEGDPKASIAKFVELCKERVYKYSDIQTNQTKRLGNFMDWEHSYFTMSEDNNYMIWHFLKKCHEEGLIYKGHDVVPWCPRCETAISQHEILTEDYKELVHDSVFVKFPLEDRDNEYLLVWTTTPWTIPANVCVSVDENLDYCLVSDNESKYWIAKETVKRVTGTEGGIIKTVKGADLVGLKYQGAFDDLPAVVKAKKESPDKFHTVIATDDQILPISTEEGTGLVHTATGAGEEDFKLGKKYSLPVISVIDDQATYLDTMGDLSGINAKKHPEEVVQRLGENGFSYKVEKYKHRYPACWRCKTELVWKVADEWYISMDTKLKDGSSLREKMMETTKKIKWLPSFGLERELDWLKNMHDWLISKKNRYWGLALPIWECTCGEFEVVGGKNELKEKTISGWDEFEGHTPHKPFIDELEIECKKCGKKVKRISDVGNPWLDAGIVPFSTISEDNTSPLYLTDRKEWENWFPADFITESFPGQFKNWFYSLIAMSTVLENTNSFKTVLGYATCLAEDGKPMHKSAGNSIEFNEAADKIGVDVMRFMYASQNPTDNMLFGYKVADETRRKFHIKLWNIYNFLVTYANLDGWKPGEEKLSENALSVLDKWILGRLSQTIKEVTTFLENFDAYKAAISIDSLVDDFSVWYVRRSRDRVGPSANDEKDKKAFYEVAFQVLLTTVKILSPINPFITEEIYKNLTKEESIHLSDWPRKEEFSEYENEPLIEEMKIIRELVEKAHFQRKVSQIPVKQPLSKVEFISPTEISKNLYYLAQEELNIKEIVIKKGDDIEAKLDTKITPELEEEAKARDLIRTIQEERKKLGLTLSDKVKVVSPWIPENAEILAKVQAKTVAVKLSQGDFSVKVLD